VPDRRQISVFAIGSFAGACFRYNGSSYDNWSADAATVLGTARALWEDTGDVVYFGSTTAAWDLLGVYLSTAGEYGAFTWEYWDGAAWTAFTPQYEGTAGFSQHGYLKLGVPDDWASTSVNSTAGYWVRASVASVTTAAEMYNLLLNVTLDAPLVLDPGEELDAFVFDINGALLLRDIATTRPLKLSAELTRRALPLESLSLLRYVKTQRYRVNVFDWAQSTPVDLTDDSYYSQYSGYITKLDGFTSARSKMKLGNGYQLELAIDSATGVLG
jgi:hypothetical protein